MQAHVLRAQPARIEAVAATMVQEPEPASADALTIGVLTALALATAVGQAAPALRRLLRQEL